MVDHGPLLNASKVKRVREENIKFIRIYHVDKNNSERMNRREKIARGQPRLMM